MKFSTPGSVGSSFVLFACLLIPPVGSTLADEDAVDKAAIDRKSDTSVSVSEVKFHRPLKEAITSFGAAVQDDYLYVFSGHDGEAHGFGADQLSKHFRRIRFDDPSAQWEDLSMHEPAQSVALVSDGESLYRIGGLTFLNDDTAGRADFKSTDHFARYDVQKNEWEALPSLPEPRSSLDAAVVGRTIYVAGGWNLQGESSDNAQWREDILSFDLDNPDEGWKSHAGPGYLTRAVSTAAFNGKLYLFGGITKKGIIRKVSIFDPATESWSKGPELPADGNTAGFATSSFATGGRLYVTGFSGIIYALGGDGSSWEHCGRLMYPRFFLRLLPAADDRLLAVAGSSSVVGRTASVESFDLNRKTDMRMTRWSVDFGGSAKHSQSLVYANRKLYAFGGNASRKPHDFSKNACVDEAFVFDVEQRDVESLAKMPMATQNSVAMQNRLNSEYSQLVLVGGMGMKDDGTYHPLDSIHTFDPQNGNWETPDSRLPAPRTMFDGFFHSDALWMIGGSGPGHGTKLDQSVLHWWGDNSNPVAIRDLKLPNPRKSFGGVVVKDRYYAIGGQAKGIVKAMDVLDLETRQWSQGQSPNIDRIAPTVCAIDDRIYLFGGDSMKGGQISACSSLEVLDTESGQWKIIADEIAGIDPSMQMMAVGDRLMFYGVDKEKDGVANFVILDPDANFVPSATKGMSFGGGRSRASADDVRQLMRRDEDRDGKLSNEELGSRLSDLLKDGDANGDNLLDRKEVEALLKKQKGSAK